MPIFFGQKLFLLEVNELIIAKVAIIASSTANFGNYYQINLADYYKNVRN
jgi:hypothetical protein